MNRSLLKTLLPILMLALASIASAIAQIPQTINYQGYLTNSASQPVNASVNVTFRLYTAPTGGAPLWQETQSSIGIANGVFTAVLGSVTPLNVPFNVPYFLSLQVNTDAEMAGRQPLSAVPYALRTATADAISPTATLPATQITGTINAATAASAVALTGTVSGAQVSGPVASATTATFATTAAGFSGALGGDITGQQGSTTIDAIRGNKVSAAVPKDGQVLTFRDGQWQPSADVANLVASVSTLNTALNALISPRAYVTNLDSNNVTVINTNINKVFGVPIAVGSSPIAIALNPSGSRAYVANQGSNNVTVIDTASNTVVGAPIAVGTGPIGIAVNPSGSRIYVANSNSNDVTVIDTASNTVVGVAIAVGSGPFAIAVK